MTRSTAQTFTPHTGAANPFDAINAVNNVAGSYRTTAFVDIDNDGDKDTFSGERDGTILYFKNSPTVLSVELVTFTGKNTEGGNQLTWTTANEVNNKGFQVERLNGNTWETLGFVKGNNKASTINLPTPVETRLIASLRQTDMRNLKIRDRNLSVFPLKKP